MLTRVVAVPAPEPDTPRTVQRRYVSVLPRLRPIGARGFYHMHGNPQQVVRVPSPLSVARLTKMDYKINGMMEVAAMPVRVRVCV